MRYIYNRKNILKYNFKAVFTTDCFNKHTNTLTHEIIVIILKVATMDFVGF